MTNFAPSRSWTSSEWTTTANNSPIVSTTMCRLHPLTFLPASIETRPFFPWNSWAGSSISLFGLLNAEPRGVVDSFPRAVLCPPLEILVHRLPRWEIVRHHSPGTTRMQNVQDAPFITSRMSTVRGLPPGLAAGSKRARSIVHLSSRLGAVCDSYPAI